MNAPGRLPTAPALEDPEPSRPWSTTIGWALALLLVNGSVGAAGGWSWFAIARENLAYCARAVNLSPIDRCGGWDAGFVLIALPLTVGLMAIAASLLTLLLLTATGLRPRIPVFLACLLMPPLSAFFYRLLISDPGTNPQPAGIVIPTLIMGAGTCCMALFSRLTSVRGHRPLRCCA
jgi:hypothetical protein